MAGLERRAVGPMAVSTRISRRLVDEPSSADAKYETGLHRSDPWKLSFVLEPCRAGRPDRSGALRVESVALQVNLLDGGLVARPTPADRPADDAVLLPNYARHTGENSLAPSHEK